MNNAGGAPKACANAVAARSSEDRHSVVAGARGHGWLLRFEVVRSDHTASPAHHRLPARSAWSGCGRPKRYAIPSVPAGMSISMLSPTIRDSDARTAHLAEHGLEKGAARLAGAHDLVTGDEVIVELVGTTLAQRRRASMARGRKDRLRGYRDLDARSPAATITSSRAAGSGAVRYARSSNSCR